MCGTHKYYTSRFQKLCQPGIGVLVLAVVLIALAVLSFQNSSLYPGSGSSPLVPVFGSASLTNNSSSESEELGAATLSDDSKTRDHKMRNRGPPAAATRDEHHSEKNETDGDPDDFDPDEEESQDEEFSVDLGDGVRLRKVKDPYGGYLVVEKPEVARNGSSVGLDGAADRERNTGLGLDKEGSLDNSSSVSPCTASNPRSSYIGKDAQVKQGNKSSDPIANVASNISSSGKEEWKSSQTIARSGEKKPLQSGAANSSRRPAKHHVRKKGEKKAPVTLSEMDQILLKNRASPRSMVPQWPSPCDMQIVEAKKQILNAPIVANDRELYAPAFRNLSMFKRSYDLMERTLKVYIYNEGSKPIFHQPHLTGIYASEGWFMKHMESNRHFVADDPREAHLFYMPFSSSRLRFELHVPGSHGHRNLVECLKNYVAAIAGKYPFWNRTGGADHFLAACHDWAPDVTAKAMGGSIRALCNADVSGRFELGRDVSLSETNVRRGDNPLQDLGGRAPTKRPLLAFFAGQMHGYLRPLLLRHWENKDPAMKVFGPLPQRRARKRKGTTLYAQYMKSSRYCICPRGYEVNSPRVVEAIFYGCVQVIVSDNFVPPFFEVLNWAAFSVVVAERDVPRLKEILEGIPWAEYLALQRGVRRVQRHFLWHNEPVRYDLFHMILHSVWFNRVFGFRTE